MIYTYEAVKREALEGTRRAAGAPVSLSLAIPPAGVAADLAIPCFPLAAALRAAPQEIATRLAAGARRGAPPATRPRSGGWPSTGRCPAAAWGGGGGGLTWLAGRCRGRASARG